MLFTILSKKICKTLILTRLSRTHNHTKSLHNIRRNLIDIHPKVEHSIKCGLPVVALESTIITHGMPHPQNYKTAREVEALVLSNGAMPATIAIINGRIKVGLTEEELADLANRPTADVIKCSRRDLPYLIATAKTGGTTVSATMIIANMAGIRVFATGGIGGVHQEGHITMDISADLVELGRTPVAVVCSGVKSILDIPRTLEYLETEGVCVTTYGDADGRFPDFYTTDSGYKVPYNVKNPKEAACLINALNDLQLESGILIACAVPAEYAADKKHITMAIEEAHLEAQANNITGKQLTPFLLSAIAKSTQGNSLKSNIALIKNNAVIAARIANELSCFQLKQNITKPKQYAPVIVGASIIDVSLTMRDELPQTLNGATYETNVKHTPGGVGRNLAEGIFKLYGDAKFISVVGNDVFGKTLLQLMPQPLQEDIKILTEEPTAICTLLFDRIGDCKIILANININKLITTELILKRERLISQAPMVIMDANLTVETMECLMLLAQKHQRPIFFEPTDMKLSGKPFNLPRELTKQIKFISPNIYELKTIVESITKRSIKWEINLNKDIDEILIEVQKLLKLIWHEFDCILVTLGQHGVLLCARGDIDKPCFDAETGDYIMTALPTHETISYFYEAPKIENIKNVSGAGDSFCSGFLNGLMRCYNMEHCIAIGFLAAECALKSDAAVPDIYFASENVQFDSLRNFIKVLKKKIIYN